MQKQLTKGNEAIVKAAVLAGCRAFYGYPITPASEIAEAASLYLPRAGGVFVENTPGAGIGRHVSESIAAMLESESVTLCELLEARMFLEVPLAGLAALQRLGVSLLQRKHEQRLGCARRA